MPIGGGVAMNQQLPSLPLTSYSYATQDREMAVLQLGI